MGLLDGAKQAILKALRDENPQISDDDFDALVRQIDDKIANEPPPRIALIGETGVGKTSTLNALFNAGLPISHTEACTQEAEEIRVPFNLASEMHIDTVEGREGDLVVYDMPGLGESISSRDRHLATYDDVLGRVDAALWVLDGPSRQIEFVQNELSKLNPKLTAHMTFALNKVDRIHPEDGWYHPANLPSPEQEHNIQRRIRDVRSKITEVLPRWAGRIVPYSAVMRYNLPQLFAAMLDGVARERRWVLAQRKSLADFFEYVDPRLLPAEVREQQAHERRPVRETAQPPSLTQAADALRDLSPEQFRRISRNKRALEEWLAEFMLDAEQGRRN